nr:hypothetical protein [Tanacetum cinerariifolium]
MDLDFTEDGKLMELNGEEAWEAIENFAQGQKEYDNPQNIIYEQELANLKAQAKRLFGDENVLVEIDCLEMRMFWLRCIGDEGVDHLTIHTPSSLHVAYFHPKDTYCYYHPCIDDPKKNYGFKPGLLGQSGSLGVDFSKLEMIEDD